MVYKQTYEWNYQKWNVKIAIRCVQSWYHFTQNSTIQTQLFIIIHVSHSNTRTKGWTSQQNDEHSDILIIHMHFKYHVDLVKCQDLNKYKCIKMNAILKISCEKCKPTTTVLFPKLRESQYLISFKFPKWHYINCKAH